MIARLDSLKSNQAATAAAAEGRNWIRKLCAVWILCDASTSAKPKTGTDPETETEAQANE